MTGLDVVAMTGLEAHWFVVVVVPSGFFTIF